MKPDSSYLWNSRLHSAPGFLLSVMASLLLMVAMSSCDPDDDYYYNVSSPLIGSWTLISDDYGPISSADQSTFDFFTDGTGYLGQYDNQGIWRTYNLTWRQVDNYLYIYPTQWAETWTYTWRVRGGYLYLYDLDSGNTLEYSPS